MGSGPGPLIVIVGETASGKSALALEIAERYEGEIICADAMTVRKGVDIGTAKPTAEERGRVPHHLLDVVEPCVDFTAAVFKRIAVEKIDEIRSRGKLPVMVGGTGLYVDAVLYDYSFLPPGDREARLAFNEMGIEELMVKINQKKIDTTGIDTRNKRRLIRLLETDGARGQKGALRQNTLMIGIRTPREKLRKNVERRVDAMLSAGLQNEVSGLANKYGWECEAMKGIGYREWQEFYNGTQNLEQTREKIIKSTLDLAKRQRTWFKRNESIQWLDNSGQAMDIAANFLNK
jgi:tRNA dimethylallyltransferase